MLKLILNQYEFESPESGQSLAICLAKKSGRSPEFQSIQNFCSKIETLNMPNKEIFDAWLHTLNVILMRKPIRFIDCNRFEQAMHDLRKYCDMEHIEKHVAYSWDCHVIEDDSFASHYILDTRDFYASYDWEMSA